MNIMDFFPAHLTPRPQQTEILQQVESQWDDARVISILAPVAVGKTAVMVTIAKWAAAKHKQASNILVPTNILVDQLLKSYPDVTGLFKKDHYDDDELYREALKNAKAAQIRGMNYHLYMAHKMYAPIMICDESHKLLDILDGIGDVKLWRSEFKFPDGLITVGDVIVWIQSQRSNPKLDKALGQIINIQDSAVVSYNRATLRGRVDTVLHIQPTTTRFIPPYLWPQRSIKKIILLSATIGQRDLHELGLDGRRFTDIVVDSPIPPQNRRVIYDPVGNMSASYIHLAVKEIAAKVEELMKANPDTKGLIHIPYSSALLLKQHLTNPRVVYHTKEDKADVLTRFKDSTEPLVMVASGMYEGVDLPYDEARWQVIAKVPYMSLGDPKVKARLAKDEDWYDWETIKKLVQSSGRIVRHPDDFGVTYILDTNFKRLWIKDSRREVKLFPKYFLDSLLLLK